MSKEKHEQRPVVIKYGTGTVTEKGKFSEDALAWYANQVAEMQRRAPVIVVSSGAVALGKEMATRNGLRIEDNLQPYAMMGSAPLVTAWQQALAEQNVLAGQLMVTHRELDDPEEGGVLARALQDCMANGIVPIVNENDALSIRELAEIAYGGDNDGLASHIARTVGAQALFLLTDVRGVTDHNSYRVRNVWFDEAAHERVLSLARIGEGDGRGGMKSKIESAKEAAAAGITTFIGPAKGVRLDAIMHGEHYGTRFEPMVEMTLAESLVE